MTDSDDILSSGNSSSSTEESFKIDDFIGKLKNGHFFCFGHYSHTESWVYLILKAIFDKLLNVSQTVNLNDIKQSYEPNSKEDTFDNKLDGIKDVFSKIVCSNLHTSHRCLQLYSDIITLCENKLEYIDCEFRLSNQTYDNLLTEDINDISVKLSKICQQHLIINKNDDHKIDKKAIKSVFNVIMNKASKLPQLKSFTIDVHKFPISCYDYYKYFNCNNNITFENITTFSLVLGRRQMAKYSAGNDIKNGLYDWIGNHKNVKYIYIEIKNYARFEEKIDITYKQRNDIKLVVIKFIEGIINNYELRERLESFDICDDLMGIRDYTNVLSQLFGTKLMNLTNLTL
eukprot:476638_1